MKLGFWIGAMPAALAMLFPIAAGAGTEQRGGKMVCYLEKWDEKDAGEGKKLVDAASACVLLLDGATGEKATEQCEGKYEYLADKSWKGSGTCVDTYPGGDKINVKWEESSNLKEFTYTNTGGTGKYEGASGTGTYLLENLTDKLSAGWFKGSLITPAK